LPLSHERPKLIGKARPATNGIRTSTKYRTKLAEQLAKVNLYNIRKTRSANRFFDASRGLTQGAGLFKLKLSKCLFRTISGRTTIVITAICRAR
jgi:hypothetical protein